MDQDKPIPGIENQEEGKALQDIVDNLLDGDRKDHREIRSRAKKHELFWHGIQKIIDDEVSRDWVTPSGYLKSHQGFEADENAMKDRPINIYRAHGESIIAALSTGLPFVKFFPDDADNADDLNTAKAASKISELVQIQNDAALKFIYALYILYNQGVVFAYNFHDEDAEYGIVQKTKMGPPTTEQITQDICPACEYPMGPDETICTQCGQKIPPDQKVPQTLDLEVPTFEQYAEPKSQEKIELFGPLNVRVPPYVKTLKKAPYLCLEMEEHVSLLKDIYPDFFDEISGSPANGQRYERWARDAYNNSDVVTVRKIWIRPFGFNVLGTDDEKKLIIEALKHKYPEGCCATFIDDRFVDAYPDSLDSHWTATESPTDTKIHADPLGAPILPIQEIRTELVELIVETVDKGIPHTFADPDVLDFTSYRENQNEVGLVHPAKARAGSNLANAFHTIHTATLNQETKELLASMDQDAQFVGGAFPSVWGGSLSGGGDTAAEYEMSRNQALQRLSTPWKMINNWWAKVMLKCVKSYIENVKDDEKFVKASGDSYINTWIRTSELAGKVGGATAETSEQFPISWVQQLSKLMELIALGNPAIDTMLYNPENSSSFSRLIGLPGFKIPGEADRDKQLAEIAELLKAGPTEEPMIDPMTGLEQFDPVTMMPMPPQIISSVPIDAEVDFHEVHIETCRSWAVSTVGRATKIENPEGYANVIAHMMEHQQYLQSTMPPPPPPGEETGETQPANEEQVN